MPVARRMPGEIVESSVVASGTSCVPGPLDGGWGVAHLLLAFGLSQWPLAVSHRAMGWWTLVSATGVSCLPVSVWGGVGWGGGGGCGAVGRAPNVLA